MADGEDCSGAAPAPDCREKSDNGPFAGLWHVAFDEVIDHPDLQALYRHWRSLAQGETPPRAAFDPFAIPRVMPNLFLMDVLPEGAFRYWLVGTAIDAHLGVSFTGRRLEEMRTGKTYDDLVHLFATVAGERRPGYYASRLASETSAYASYRRLVLPLAEPDGSIAVLLGGFCIVWASDNLDPMRVTSFANAPETGGTLIFQR